MPLYGVDVASYQGEPSWTKVHASGIRFAFSKVTEDTDYTNPTWPHNRAGMLALGDGFLPGAYHFLHGGNGTAQARHFLSEAGDVSGFAVALDVEASGANASTARDWVEEFKSETGGHPVFGYFPRWYWDQQGRPSLSFFDTIWQSHCASGTGSAAPARPRPSTRRSPPRGGSRSAASPSASCSTPAARPFRGSPATATSTPSAAPSTS